MLKRNKRGNSQADWIAAYRYAWIARDVKRASKLIDIGLSRLPENVDDCIYGWSGGKDAMALQVICEEAGIHKSVISTAGVEWEYPSFWEFVEREAPAGCVVGDLGLTEEFFIEHPEYVFPVDNQHSYKWYQLAIQKPYYDYAKEQNAKHIILGHRTADQNICKDRRGKGKVYPMHDFSHEDVFCILACTGHKLPDVYFMSDGFNNGTHAWIRKHGPTAVAEVYELIPEVLERHKNIKKIGDYLRGK